LFFGAVFCIEQLQCFPETFSVCFFVFLIFDPKSIAFVAIFGNFQNAPIFGIVAGFPSRFLHGTTGMLCKNHFSMFFCIFNF